MSVFGIRIQTVHLMHGFDLKALPDEYVNLQVITFESRMFLILVSARCFSNDSGARHYGLFDIDVFYATALKFFKIMPITGPATQAILEVILLRKMNVSLTVILDTKK